MTDDMKNMIETEEDTQKDKYLTFLLDKDVYGLEINYVKEIVEIQTITELPELPEYVKGIINLRGKIIPVVDVRIRFRKARKEYNDRTCIIVVDIKDISIGLIVDSVTEVLAIPEQDIVDPPQMNRGKNNKYINKIGKDGNNVKLLLDCEKLLTEKDIDDLEQTI
jgi:purine-binding chemotaxis protein CheW